MKATKLQWGLVAANVVLGGAIGPFVYAPSSATTRALGALEFAASAVVTMLIAAAIVWGVLAVARRRRAFKARGPPP